MEEAEWILEERHRKDHTGICPECQAEAEGDDGYCEQCNDYHDEKMPKKGPQPVHGNT